jgi:hypothetical protein
MYVFALRLDSMFELNIFNFGACTQAAKRIFGPRGKRKLPPPSSNSPTNDTQTMSPTVCHTQGISTTKMN